MKRIIWTAIITLLIVFVVPLVVIASGLINMGATTSPGVTERSIAALALNGSVAMRAPNESNPYEGDQVALATGLEHYASMCARCHGGPDIAPEPFAQGLNPSAPALGHAAEEFSDGDLFWITKHGIRMTGMPAFGPTHSDEDIWKIAAFVKQLPALSDEQKQRLKSLVDSGSAHQHGEHHDASKHSHSSEESHQDHSQDHSQHETADEHSKSE